MCDQEQILKKGDELFKDEVNAFCKVVSTLLNGVGGEVPTSRERKAVITFPGESWETWAQFFYTTKNFSRHSPSSIYKSNSDSSVIQ